MARVLDLNNVTVLRDKKPVLNNVDWQVDSDQRWVIIGPNGAGKTTLLRVAAAQIQPSSGKAIVLGQTLGQVNVFELRTRIGFASNALSSHIPNSETVLNSVMTASYAITGRWNEEYDDVDVRRALRVLNEWQLSEIQAALTEAEAEAHIVETVLEQFQQVGSGGTLLGARFLHVAHELTLGDAVVEAKLLLLFEADGVFGALATGLAVLTGGIRPLSGLTGETGKVSQAPRNPQTRAAVARHRKP